MVPKQDVTCIVFSEPRGTYITVSALKRYLEFFISSAIIRKGPVLLK